MENTNIAVEIKHQYGVERIYPQYLTDVIYQLTGLRTIRREDLAAWKRLGIEFTTPASETLREDDTRSFSCRCETPNCIYTSQED